MRHARVWAAALVLVTAGLAEADVMRMIVSHTPYPRVWAAALGALEGHSLVRAAEGVIVTERRERPPRPNEAAFDRVAERFVLRIQAVEADTVRVTIEVDAEGMRDGVWVPIAETESSARALLARMIERLG